MEQLQMTQLKLREDFQIAKQPWDVRRQELHSVLSTLPPPAAVTAEESGTLEGVTAADVRSNASESVDDGSSGGSGGGGSGSGRMEQTVKLGISNDDWEHVHTLTDSCTRALVHGHFRTLKHLCTRTPTHTLKHSS